MVAGPLMVMVWVICNGVPLAVIVPLIAKPIVVPAGDEFACMIAARSVQSPEELVETQLLSVGEASGSSPVLSTVKAWTRNGDKPSTKSDTMNRNLPDVHKRPHSCMLDSPL
jgi:hypothetical protein